MLHQTHFMIVDCVARQYYVQFIATRQGELYCEAVGNHYLAREDWLDAEDELNLIGLGWSSPTPNYSQLWDEPIPFDEVACRMARTLTTVFGVRSLDDVAFTYGRVSRRT
jgi:hypothetical protein